MLSPNIAMCCARALIVLMVASLSACKIVIRSGDGGSVHYSGGICTAAQTCELTVSDYLFSDTFTAVPDDGFRFIGWRERDRGLCGGSSDACQLSTLELPMNPSVQALLESDDERFFLIAQFARDLGSATPVVTTDSSYQVLVDEDITYADGLSQEPAGGSLYAKPQLLDAYYPDNDATNRPVFVFIHGGGFTGGTKTKPEIVEMANYYASRGWVFFSIDYRTTEELGSIQGKTQEELLEFYRGIAPREWIEFTLRGAETPKQIQQSIAMYAAQRDAKASIRWVVANSATYSINTDFIAVGGASAGAITAITLGISEQEDFRDEISVSDDPTLSTTNLGETYAVRSLVYFWGSNVKLELFESVYGLNRYDGNDPELFIAHGTEDRNPSTPFSEAVELQDIYDPLGVYNELVPLEGEGHGAWRAEVDGKGLYELTFDFLVERQNLELE